MATPEKPKQWCMSCQGLRDIAGSPRDPRCVECNSGRIHAPPNSEAYKQARIAGLSKTIAELQAELNWLMGKQLEG